MKQFFCCLLLLVNLPCLSTAASDLPMNELTIKIREVSPSGSISVEVGNTSKKPIRIWKESNTWGAARWRVLLIREGQLKTFFQNPDQGFTRNVPGFEEIAVGGHVDRKLDLKGGNWRGMDGANISFEPGDTVIAIYDVPKQFGWSEASVVDATRKMGVWYGVAAAFTTVQ
jgi:hypothetical protein